MAGVGADQNLIAELMFHLLGKTRGDVQREAPAAYPQEDIAENHPAHRMAASLTARKFGLIPSQLLGLGLEGKEAFEKQRRGDEGPLVGYKGGAKFDLSDLGANLRGGLEGSLAADQPKGFGNALLKGALRGAGLF